MLGLRCLGNEIRDHPYITSAKGLGGWGQKKAVFVDVQYCIYADLVRSGWVRKSPNIMLMTIRMVPIYKSICFLVHIVTLVYLFSWPDLQFVSYCVFNQKIIQCFNWRFNFLCCYLITEFRKCLKIWQFLNLNLKHLTFVFFSIYYL